ncbi:hypothetical protein [Sphingosinicella sp.]|uniref:hypothetical protein n=1 Tax=Sphingosinicella sp. TaxID=1917971 RepID=UPI00260CA0FA|nr:hypothetical protein [Sphingosinicella sp.]
MNKPTPRGAAAWAAAVAAYATARAAELAHYAEIVAPACETDDVSARVAAEASYGKFVDATDAALAKAFETPASDFDGALWKLDRLADEEGLSGAETRERIAAISADLRRLSAPRSKVNCTVAYPQTSQTTAACMVESYRKGDMTISELIRSLADIHDHAKSCGGHADEEN